MQTDFLVIGSGIAGLTYALKISEAKPDCQVIVMTKTSSDETNTKYAQGGVAAVWDDETDNFEKHIEDIPLGVTTLSSLGIIVNELITNAMKYAFAGMADEERGAARLQRVDRANQAVEAA